MGPAVSIPLREALSTQQLQELDQWLHTLGDVGYDATLGWELFVRNYGELGIDGIAKRSCAFWLSVRPELTIEMLRGTSAHEDKELRRELEEERQEYINALGYPVAYRMSVSTGCNGAIDHRILAQIAIRLATRYNTVIDLNGAFIPNRPMSDAELRLYLHRLGGRVFELFVAPDGRVRHHMMDVDFLKAWLEHPDFRMTK